MNATIDGWEMIRNPYLEALKHNSMGYHLFSYAIDSVKVKSVIGTTDPELFDTVLETEEFDLYASQDMGRDTTTKAALEQLILGKRHSLFSKYDKASAHAYWYAFIAICGCLGERLPASHEIKDGIRQYSADQREYCLLPGQAAEHDHLLPLAGTVSTFIPFRENSTSKLLWNSTKPAFSRN